MICSSPFGENFFLCALSRTIVLAPNSLRCATYGLLPANTSKGVISGSVDITARFLKYEAVLIASSQNPSGRPACNSILRPISTNVQLARSATPFCCGVCGAVRCLRIPLLTKTCSNAPLKYSRFQLFTTDTIDIPHIVIFFSLQRCNAE